MWSCAVTRQSFALVVLAARDGAPERDRADLPVRDQRDQRPRRRRPAAPGSAAASAAAPSTVAATSGGIAPGGVVEVDRGLGRRRRERRSARAPAGPRAATSGESRNRKPSGSSRCEQVVEVVAAGTPARAIRQRMRDRRLRDPAGRAADRVVAAVERRVGAGVVVRDRRRRSRAPRRARPATGDRRARPRAGRRIAYQIPSPATTNPISSFVVIASTAKIANGTSRSSSRYQNAKSRNGRGERDRVELVQRQPLRRRVEQVDEREPERGAVAAEVLAREPEDGQRAERDDDRLDDEQHLRARPDPPERREGGEDRVEVRGEPRDLPPVAARHLEEVAVRRVPDRLHHVPEVVAAGVERAVAEDRERARSRPHRRRSPPRAARGRLTASDSISVAPARAEHVLARLRAVGGEPAARRAPRARVGCDAPERVGERLRVAGRDEQRALAVARAALARPACRR